MEFVVTLEADFEDTNDTLCKIHSIKKVKEKARNEIQRINPESKKVKIKYRGYIKTIRWNNKALIHHKVEAIPYEERDKFKVSFEED